MKMIATFFVVFAFASSAFGECPVPQNIPGADIGKIAGQWHTVINDFEQKPPYNSTFDVTPRVDGDFDLEIVTTFPNRTKSALHGLAKRTDNQYLLDIYIDSPKVPYQITFNIVDIDYETYLFAYICHVEPEKTFIIAYLNAARPNIINADKN